MSLQIFQSDARAHHVDAGHLRPQYQIIDVALRLGKFSIDRKSAGDVRCIAFVFRARVNQKQVAVA